MIFIFVIILELVMYGYGKRIIAIFCGGAVFLKPDRGLTAKPERA